MSDFQFDTSGVVTIRDPMWRDHETWNTVRWPDLSPFMQGYVRAAFESLIAASEGARLAGSLGFPLRFDMLAPATLAAMMADCEKRISLHAPLGWSRDSETQGREFFRRRQKGDWAILFPPVTLQIHDDGLVYQEARS